MTIEISGRHLSLTPSIKSHTEEKLLKLGRLVENLEIHVTLSAEKHRHTCTIVGHGKKASYTSEVTGDDVFATVNEAVENLSRQLRKSKTSRLADRRGGAESIRHLGDEEPSATATTDPVANTDKA